MTTINEDGRRPHLQNIININSGNTGWCGNPVSGGNHGCSGGHHHHDCSGSHHHDCSGSHQDLLDKITSLEEVIEDISNNVSENSSLLIIHGLSLELLTISMESANSTISQHTSEILDLSGRVDYLYDTSFIEQLEDLSSGILELQQLLAEIEEHTHDVSFQVLLEQISSISGDLYSLSGDLHSLTSEVVSLSGDLHSLTSDVVSLSGDLHSLTSDVVSLSGDLHSLTSDVVSLSGDLHSLTSDVVSLSGDLHSLTSDVGIISNRILLNQSSILFNANRIEYNKIQTDFEIELLKLDLSGIKNSYTDIDMVNTDYELLDRLITTSSDKTLMSMKNVYDLIKRVITEGVLIRGTSGNDIIRGTHRDDYIYGGNGNDIIYGGAGYDTIFGGYGDDIIYGEDGDDLIYGGYGDDIIYGGYGDDIIYGGYGDDIIYAGYGRNVIYSGEGNDTIYITHHLDNQTFHIVDLNTIKYIGEGKDYMTELSDGTYTLTYTNNETATINITGGTVSFEYDGVISTLEWDSVNNRYVHNHPDYSVLVFWVKFISSTEGGELAIDETNNVEPYYRTIYSTFTWS